MWQYFNRTNYCTKSILGNRLNFTSVMAYISMCMKPLYWVLCTLNRNFHHKTHLMCLYGNICYLLSDSASNLLLTMQFYYTWERLAYFMLHWHHRKALLAQLQWCLIVENLISQNQISLLAPKIWRARAFFLRDHSPAMFSIKIMRPPS